MRTSGKGRHALLRPEQHMSTRSCWTAPSPPPSCARCRSPQVQWWCEAWSATWSCRHALALYCWLLLATVQYSTVPTVLYCAVPCCHVLCCAALCCVVLCRAQVHHVSIMRLLCSRTGFTTASYLVCMCKTPLPPALNSLLVAAQLTTAACVSCQA